MNEDKSDHLEAEAGLPRPNLTSAIAIVTVLAISIGSIGAMIAARHNRAVGAVVSGARLTSPIPSLRHRRLSICRAAPRWSRRRQVSFGF